LWKNRTGHKSEALCIVNDPLKKIQELTLPLRALKGVGPKRARSLAQKGLRTVLDLIFFTPIRYEDRREIIPIGDAPVGRRALVQGEVLFGKEDIFPRRRKRLFRIVIRDRRDTLDLLWFYYKKPHLDRFAPPGTRLLVFGDVQLNRGRRQMIHPEILSWAGKGKHLPEQGPGYHPVYSAVPDLSPGILRSLIQSAVDQHLQSLMDPLPSEILDRLDLPDLAMALRGVHRPPGDRNLDHLNRFCTPDHRRLKFDRFFLVMLTMAYLKKKRRRRKGPVFSPPQGFPAVLESFFSFPLTEDQENAVRDITRDLSTGTAMSRLLMGDVGCGKTVVAAAAAHLCVFNGAQTALMVPTQILANQHMAFFSELPAAMGFRPALLTGSLHKKELRDLSRGIQMGRINLIIGTQALIQESLTYHNLGLAVIDEQHRFGVRERALLDRKGNNPHLLVMTATPIPRTLAITAYGDMDLSVIQTYPKGRKPVSTEIVSADQKRGILDTLTRALSRGERAFVICPLIEVSEEKDLKDAMDMAQKLKNIFEPRFHVGLVHGRLPADEREAVMERFKTGQIHLLVGTTVIEVGIHVPEATVMVIEHAERFGLSQIHQLRGRIGRGKNQGHCFLVPSPNLSEKARSRLLVLTESQDGFQIAKKDLDLRGQGELVGMRQSGVGELDFSNIMDDPKLLLLAREEAKRMIDSDPALSRVEHALLKRMIQSIVSKPLDL
jgi:ATP-dependent DNA helicase RecG